MESERNAWLLYADDDDIDQLLFKKAVAKYRPNITVTTCTNGEEGLSILQANIHHLPQIIFSDVNMSKVNGFELLKSINEDPILKKRAIPFIFLSNSKVPFEIETAYGLNAKGFFPKTDNNGQYGKDLDCIITYWEKAYTLT